MPFPEDKKLSDEAKRAVGVIKDVMKSGIEKDNVYLLTALAPASFFDDELKEHFQKYAVEKANNIYDEISVYIINRKLTLDAFFSVEGTLTLEVLINIMRIRRDSDIPLQTAAKLQTGPLTDNIDTRICILQCDERYCGEDTYLRYK